MFCIEFFYRNDIIVILYLRSLKMNFLHLKYLIEVEKYESISKAAQHLYINQPRLSKIIKEIEEEANIKIFERHNKGVVPTTKGREFLSQAKKIVQEVDYLKNMYQDDPHKLNLDICVPRSSYISEAFIEYLKMDNNMKKKLNLNYRETNSFDTIQNVYDGENNLGIVRFPLRDQDYYFNILNLKELTYEKLFTFDYQILISKDNPLKDKDIYMKDLKKQIVRYDEKVLHSDLNEALYEKTISSKLLYYSVDQLQLQAVENTDTRTQITLHAILHQLILSPNHQISASNQPVDLKLYRARYPQRMKSKDQAVYAEKECPRCGSNFVPDQDGCCSYCGYRLPIDNSKWRILEQ